MERYTESNARRKRNSNRTFSLEELKALISNMYAQGVVCTNGMSVTDLWSRSWESIFIKDTMTKDRFQQLLRFLRFDKISTRTISLPTHKFALVFEIWEFTTNCIRSYCPGENITIDKQVK